MEYFAIKLAKKKKTPNDQKCLALAKLYKLAILIQKSHYER